MNEGKGCLAAFAAAWILGLTLSVAMISAAIWLIWKVGDSL